VVSKRVFEDIVQIIKSDIASNKLKPNHKLGSERSLLQRFKVGRGSIREAIKTLEAIGLVTLKHGRGGGIFVSETASDKTTSALSSLLRLEKSNLLESLEFRKMIEPKMTFYAAIRRNKDDLTLLRKSVNEMKRNLNSRENFSKANLAFHLAMAEAAHNPFLYSFYQNATAMLKDTARLVQDVPGQLDLTIHFHTQIYKAVLDKEPQKSEMLMNAHLSQIENDIRIARDLAVDIKGGR
jgi:GntR family transcriptional regulator, transcriptional repressor for pyruvate dehydrogenase complex